MESPNSVLAFYQDVIRRLAGNGIEFLVGGGYAFGHYTGLHRDTKDFDLMVRPSAVAAVISICQSAGYQADYAFSHWLAKVRGSEGLIDIILRSSNGLCEVDDEWFAAAPSVEILETPVHLVPPEGDLISRYINDEQHKPSTEQICNGTLLSRQQYRYDVMVEGLQDARLSDRCRISPEELNIWDNASSELT
jgi:hypothetical protein